MEGSIPKTGERLIPEKCDTLIEYLLYLRHLFAYRFVRESVRADADILEVGCGEGYGTGYLSRSVVRITGIDVDAQTIAYAEGRYGSENCLFEKYDGKRIPYPDRSFDDVVSFQVIEHVEDDTGYVAEIFRVLKEGGVFFVTTPNRTYRLRRGQKPWNKFHLREYYPGDLEKTLRTSFADVDIWGIRGTEEVQEIEKERVRQPSILSLYISRAVKLLPECIRARLRRDAKGETAGKDEGTGAEAGECRDFIDRYSIDDYKIIRENVKDSLDLLGICRK